MIKTVQRVDEIIDFAWELSQNKLHASYPRVDSIEELKEELLKANILRKKILKKMLSRTNMARILKYAV